MKIARFIIFRNPLYKYSLALIHKYVFMYFMKTTLDLPDELYAVVKARAALERRSLRSVVMELLEKWMAGGLRLENPVDQRNPRTSSQDTDKGDATPGETLPREKEGQEIPDTVRLYREQLRSEWRRRGLTQD